MGKNDDRVCPMSRAKSLDTRFRRWWQNPDKILCPYIKEGMTVLDVGCGPGFFTIDMAEMVGESGRIIACDLQQGMLDMLRQKIQGTELESRITLQLCMEDSINVTKQVEFVLAFYLVHEVPDQQQFFREVGAILSEGGKILVVEPPLHVSKKAFNETIRIAQATGFMPIEKPKLLFSKAVVFVKSGPA
jgi:ubiquinone/menaquinone biosynthesis C-methylase UbiE